MHRFSDFAKEEKGMEGDKVSISELFNQTIVVLA